MDCKGSSEVWRVLCANECVEFLTWVRCYFNDLFIGTINFITLNIIIVITYLFITIFIITVLRIRRLVILLPLQHLSPFSYHHHPRSDYCYKIWAKTW